MRATGGRPDGRRALQVTSLKHEQIAATLAQEIRAGQMIRGRQLPGESALAERFSVSRNTVRAALHELSEAGLIATRSGKGSFVTYDGRLLDVQAGWAHALREQGVDVTVEVLQLARVCDDALAVSLDISTPDFIAIDRVRRLPDGRAISLERSRVPLTPDTEDLPTRGLIDDSLTRSLADRGLVGARGEQRVNARPLSAVEAGILGRTESDWFLHAVRTTRSTTGRLVEHVDSVLDPVHFELRLEFGDE
jgi:GntR family transcriptional regulator